MPKRIPSICVLAVFVLALVPARARAEQGYWKRVGGARFEKGTAYTPPPGRLDRFEADGGEGQVNAVSFWDDISHKGQPAHKCEAQFTWSLDRPAATLIPGQTIKVTGTLSHDGEQSANAGIAFQPVGMRPGTRHISGSSILAGFDNTANRSNTRSAEFAAPDRPLFPDKKIELRFEIHARYSAAVYYTYEWVEAANPPVVTKEPPKEPEKIVKPRVPTPPQEKPDLHIDPDSIVLAQTDFNTPGWWHTCGGDRDLHTLNEPAADQQAITVRVTNRSAKVTAKNVRLEVFAQKAGQTDRTPAQEGDLGDIPPGGKTEYRTHIDLEGRNVESITLFFRVSTPDVEDVNEDDNTAGIEFSVYYAAEGGRAFSVQDDTYGFGNYGLEEREAEELLEGLLATLLSGMRLDAGALHVMQRLWFGGTWQGFADMTLLGTISGIGGHCYGMSATAALYFEEPSLRPAPKPIRAMTIQEASYSNNLYQRAQLLPIFTAVMEQKLAFDLFPNPTRCYQDVKASLRDERRALILGFTNDWGPRSYRLRPEPMMGHAVLAYKLIEVSGRNPLIYVYDCNFVEKPAAEGDVKSCGMNAVEINLNKDEWHYRGEYNWAHEKYISAFRPHRTMPLDATSTRVINAIKEVYSKMIEDLDKANELMAILRCPADAVFTDEKGRRTGVVGGKVLTEIPGSKVLSKGEVEVYRLPESGRYSFAIRGTGNGKAGFDIIRAAGPREARLTSFGDIPIDGKAMLSGTLEPEGGVRAISDKERAYEPLIIGSMKGDKVAWEKAPSKFAVLLPSGPAPGAPEAGGAGGVASGSGGAASYAGIPDKRKQAAYFEGFDDNKGKWITGLIANGTGRLLVEDGHYLLQALDANSKSAWRTDVSIDTGRDFEIEARLMFVRGLDNQGQGILWGGKDRQNEHRFLFAANGYYRIYKAEAGKYPDIVGWKKTDLVKPDDYVTLTVRKSGGTYFFFLNKVLVHKMPFEPFFGQQIGFQCGKSSATIVDYLRISYLK